MDIIWDPIIGIIQADVRSLGYSSHNKKLEFWLWLSHTWSTCAFFSAPRGLETCGNGMMS